ncbi:hypothetical protein EV715DRAFT_209295 [Schizophyllum commune]
MSVHVSQTYAYNLLPTREGYPLWVPEPFDNLPESYRETGVRIGDVGIISKEGAFSTLFNICSPADDPINRYGGVPPDFETIDAEPIRRIEHYFPSSGASVHSAKMQARGGGLEAGSAALALPRGAVRQDAQNHTKFEQQICRHGLTWYKYAKEGCGVKFDNGELYLITGVDKAPVWGTLAFLDMQGTHTVSFNLDATPQMTAGLYYDYRWQKLSKQTARRGPEPEAALYRPDRTLVANQCVFLRGFRIMIRDEIWTRLLSGTTVKVMDFTSPTNFKQSVSSLTRPPRSFFPSSPSERRLRPAGPPDANMGSEDCEGEAVDGPEASAMPVDAVDVDYDLMTDSEPVFHPSDALNRILLNDHVSWPNDY